MKSTKILTILVLVLGLVSNASADLVAHYQFEGNVNDSSGNGLHGSLVDGASIIVDPERGNVLSLDGVGDYVDCGNDPRFDITNNITVMSWIKVDAFDKEWQAVVTKGDSAWRLHRWSSTRKMAFFCTAAGGGRFRAIGTVNVNDGQWHHVAGVYDGSKIYMYMDGVLDNSEVATKTINTNTFPVLIGENAEATGRNWSGWIDDVRIHSNALTDEKIQDIMRSDPFAAWNPNPPNGAVDVEHKPILTWLPGFNLASYEIYFGTDADAVKNATTDSPEYVGPKALGDESYDPEKLALQTTYYWRVDRIDNTNPDSPWTGNIWAFATGDYIVLDDIESYNNIDPPDPKSNRIFDKWIDGLGIVTNGSLVGNEVPPYAEQDIVHSGKQSMPIAYDNNSPFAPYSEVKWKLEPPQDWTEERVTKLSLFFRGDPSNAVERMYVNLNGIATVYHENPDAALIGEWTEWTIGLDEFIILADAFLTNVDSFAIGFGTKGGQATGSTGKVFIDDLRLKR